jgi:prepilin-type N-terminal cleavage/methylation domain-containing protein
MSSKGAVPKWTVNGMGRKSFTLIELLIVVALLSILSATSVTLYHDSERNAKLEVAIQAIQTVKRAATVTRISTKKWPKGTSNGYTIAPDFGGLMPADFFGSEAPFGGQWRWYYGSTAMSGEIAALVITFSDGVDRSDYCQKIDGRLDDGTATTGNVRYSGTSLNYYLDGT